MTISACGPTNTVNTGCGNDSVHISKADGLAGLLGSLRAKGPWLVIVREFVEGARHTTELGRLSAETSADAAV